jgi:hypothetical protein
MAELYHWSAKTERRLARERPGRPDGELVVFAVVTSLEGEPI